MRVILACYAVMAVVTVVATGIGFWLSYAGLHAFAARAGLAGAEAWAWPSSVDLFILAGELGITISTLRDGAADWRAWVYFAAGAGPSITFNVLHVSVAPHSWAQYAVAATPPVAAVLALAALMQQVISLPDALRHMGLAGPAAGRGTVPAAVPTGAEDAAMIALRATLAAGNPLNQNQLMERFGLSRATARNLRQSVIPEASLNGSGGNDV